MSIPTKHFRPSHKALETLVSVVKENRAGRKRGLYSVCSAHPGVLRAAMDQARCDESVLLIESTSNQVDQFGGYTGMKPEDFVAFVLGLAKNCGFPTDRILLGGDHLGPNRWQDKNADQAMADSRDLVSSYISAGYTKIHLDCSMFLADDTGDRSRSLPDEIVARRAAELCRVAEEAHRTLPAGSPSVRYVIGTEVPVPGGSREHEDYMRVTPAAEARHTVEITRKAFLDRGLDEAWERVHALVVQPGVEFGDDRIFDYRAAETRELSGALDDVPGMVFEAHSTDYQKESALSDMVEGHFCIQKVGPWLTYAWREALFALADMETELCVPEPSRLKEVLDQAMVQNPSHWKTHYHGSEKEQAFKRKYSYSDRSRYYWPCALVSSAVETLFRNLRNQPLSPNLLSQYMPAEYEAWRAGILKPAPNDLALYHVRLVLARYARACGLDSKEVI